MKIWTKLGLKAVCVLCVIIACILWASSGVITLFVRDYGFGSDSIGFLKWFYTALIAFVILLILDRKSLRINRKILCLALLMGVVNIIASLASIEAVFSIPTGLADVLQNLSPYFTMVMAFLIFKDKITKKQIVCACIGVAGCALIQLNTSGGDVAIIGVLLSILAAAMFAASNVGMKAMLNDGVTIVAVLFYINLFSAIIYLPMLDMSNIAEPLVAHPESFFVCMLIFAVVAFAPMLLNAFALRALDVTTITIMGLLEVFFATIIGVLFLGESYDAGALVGLIAILVSGLMVNYEFKKDAEDVGGT